MEENCLKSSLKLHYDFVIQILFKMDSSNLHSNSKFILPFFPSASRYPSVSLSFMIEISNRGLLSKAINREKGLSGAVLYVLNRVSVKSIVK